MTISTSKKYLVLINVMGLASVLLFSNHLLISKGRRHFTLSDIMREHAPAVLSYRSFVEALAARADADGYVILAMSDESFVDMAINFYEASLRAHHVDNFLFVGVGRRTCEQLRDMSISCFYYADDPSAGNQTSYGQPAFIRKMNIRTDMILEALAANFTVIHTDIDIAFLANPVPQIKVEMTDADVAPLWDSIVYNAGFIVIKPTPQGIQLYEQIRYQTQKSAKLADQDSLNMVVKRMKRRHYNLRLRALNKRRFLSGYAYFEGSGRLFPRDEDCTTLPYVFCPIVVHNNWIASKNAKIYRFREHLMWLYDGDDHYYSSETRNYLTYENPQEFGKARQMSALISALAVGHLLNRVVILPMFLCVTPKGRIRNCPLNSLIQISTFETYFKGQFRESSFLRHPKVPEAVKREIYDGTKALNRNITANVTSRALIKLFDKVTARVLKLGNIFGVEVIFDDKLQNKTFNEHVQKAIQYSDYRQLHPIRT